MILRAVPDQVSPPAISLAGDFAALLGAEVAAVPVCPGPDGPMLGPGAAELEEHLGLDLIEVLSPGSDPERAGRVVTVPVARAGLPRTVLLIGVGEQTPDELRTAGAALARQGKGRSALATSLAAGADGPAVAAFVTALTLGSFSFHWRSDGPGDAPVPMVVLCGLPAEAQPDLDRGRVLAEAAWRARTLATVPSHIKNPAWLADVATDLAAEHGLQVSVWQETDLRKHGMGGLLGVGAASATPPRLIRLDYAPPRAGRRTPRVVLVGKGITFDSGGLSIKPAESMSTMKRDMSGGAVVLAVLAGLAAVGCPVRVTGLVAAAENAVDGDAVRPGDVLTHFGGRTTEVTNTDAEGRLVLADALAYAVAELKPAAVVDVATLTGAVKVTLGQSLAGVFANDDALADALIRSGSAAGEPMWRLPLVRDYESRLESGVADADNAASGPGAVMAALFLSKFVGKVPWAHLDIASVGDARKDEGEWTSGPTGFGARALLTWLSDPEGLPGRR